MFFGRAWIFFYKRMAVRPRVQKKTDPDKKTDVCFLAYNRRILWSAYNDLSLQKTETYLLTSHCHQSHHHLLLCGAIWLGEVTVPSTSQEQARMDSSLLYAATAAAASFLMSRQMRWRRIQEDGVSGRKFGAESGEVSSQYIKRLGTYCFAGHTE